MSDAVELGSSSWMHFEKKGWSADLTVVEAFVNAITRTSVWNDLKLLSVGGAAAKPRGDAAAEIKAAVKSGKARFALLDQGKNIYSDDASAYIEVQIAPRAATIVTLTRGKILARLGEAALNDFFTIFRSLHDSLGGAAHVICATAFTHWRQNTPSSKLDSDWPLRVVADVLEPGRRKEDERDVFWDAAQAIATGSPPVGVTRTTHGGLVELRWVTDPSDGPAANAGAVKHEEWVRTLVKTSPL